MKRKKAAFVLTGILVVIVVVIAFAAVPFWVARGTFGRTFLDKPNFSIVAVNLSKNGTDCYIRSTTSNTGNVFVARLTLSLNGTFVFSDAWVPPGGIDDNWQRFYNYGLFHCADVQVGQVYSASAFAEFSDGVNQSSSMTLEVGPYPLPPPPF